MTPNEAPPDFLAAYLAQQPETGQPASSADEELRPGEWRGIWTWIQRVDGEVLPASLEILGRGRELADELGTRNVAVLFGHGIEKDAARLGEYGADRVYVADHPALADFGLKFYREALLGLVQEKRPEAIILPATVQGRNLGAQLSAALSTGIVPNCAAVTLDPSERLIVGHQTSFEERLRSEIVCPADRPQLFTVTPGSYRKPPLDRGRTATVIPVTPRLPEHPPKVRVLERVPDLARTLSQYDAIVAAGLGVASKESFDLTVELAKELDAYAGATRGAVACRWADAERLITVTKHRLRPRLYVAAGVVGEYDHLKAIEQADFVVGITDDSNAPIVENADLVGIGDPAEILRRLVDQLQRARQDKFEIPTPSRT